MSNFYNVKWRKRKRTVYHSTVHFILFSSVPLEKENDEEDIATGKLHF